MVSQAQIDTVIRYVGANATGAAALLVFGGVVPADTAHAIVEAVQRVCNDLKQLIGDSYLLAGLVIPIAATWIAKMGWNSARPDSQKQSVIAAQPNTIVVETSSPTAAKAVADAVAALPAVNKIVSTQAVADATDSEKVVAK